MFGFPLAPQPRLLIPPSEGSKGNQVLRKGAGSSRERRRVRRAAERAAFSTQTTATEKVVENREDIPMDAKEAEDAVKAAEKNS